MPGLRVYSSVTVLAAFTYGHALSRPVPSFLGLALPRCLRSPVPLGPLQGAAPLQYPQSGLGRGFGGEGAPTLLSLGARCAGLIWPFSVSWQAGNVQPRITAP